MTSRFPAAPTKHTTDVATPDQCDLRLRHSSPLHVSFCWLAEENAPTVSGSCSLVTPGGPAWRATPPLVQAAFQADHLFYEWFIDYRLPDGSEIATVRSG